MGSYCLPGFSTHSIKSTEDVSIDLGPVCEVCLMLIGHATDHNHKDRWFKSKRWWMASRPVLTFTLFAVVFSALYERKLPDNGEVTAGIVILTSVNKWHHYSRVKKRQSTDSVFILIKRWAARTNGVSYEKNEICLFWQCISAHAELGFKCDRNKGSGFGCSPSCWWMQKVQCCTAKNWLAI